MCTEQIDDQSFDAAIAAGSARAAPDRGRLPGRVALYNVTQRLGSTHERATREQLARRVASLKGWEFVGEQAKAPDNTRTYYLPNDTLVGVHAAHALGITSEADFLGGLVPFTVIGTKAIAHPLVRPDALSAPGWSRDFTHAVEDVVLRGYTCFTIEDARIAAARLLQHGRFRIKPVRETGGRGQKVIASLPELEDALARIDTAELARVGLVLEENLASDIITYSVGTVRLDDVMISYYGVQRLVSDNQGRAAYGGSDLTVTRGGFEELLAVSDLSASVREAVRQAYIFDAAASKCFPGLIASRRNYDVIQGTLASGSRCSGVLEQSWRIGGATPAEIMALEGFRDNSHARKIRACGVEVYGQVERLPDNAVIYFQGCDEEVGPITKFAYLKPHECGREGGST